MPSLTADWIALRVFCRSMVLFIWRPMTDAQILSIVSRWQAKFNGLLVVSSNQEYSLARKIWNGMVDKRPALIARCTSSEDVKSAIRLARTEGLHVSVRGGGHGVAGAAVCQGGLMIDLSPMKNVVVDPAQRELIAEPGVLWGELDRAAESHGSSHHRWPGLAYGHSGPDSWRRSGLSHGKARGCL